MFVGTSFTPSCDNALKFALFQPECPFSYGYPLAYWRGEQKENGQSNNFFDLVKRNALPVNGAPHIDWPASAQQAAEAHSFHDRSTWTFDVVCELFVLLIRKRKMFIGDAQFGETRSHWRHIWEPLGKPRTSCSKWSIPGERQNRHWNLRLKSTISHCLRSDTWCWSTIHVFCCTDDLH